MRHLPCAVALAAALAAATAVQANADGPDYWRVTGIAAGEELNMRRGPSTQFGIAAKLPHDTGALLNMGCYPDFSPAEWEALNERERKLAASMRWCHVLHRGQAGWIYARYLKEDT